VNDKKSEQSKTVKLGATPLRYEEVGGLTPQKILASMKPGQVVCLVIVATDEGELWIRHVGAGRSA
jgi:hypothetical protein